MLEVKNLRKKFGPVQAVDGVSFSVSKGESVGFLGPNGAGKTTTLSIVIGFLAADEGEVLLDGRPLAGDGDPAKRRIGYVPQDLALYEELSAQANLNLFGALYGLSGATLAERVRSALELVGLADRARDRAGTFSGGMKRRLNLAAALLHEPELLLLDEPTVGVDPQSRNAIFENLESLKARGMTLLYTTHYMEEVERLCQRAVIIDHGKIVADDALQSLFRQHALGAAVDVELEGAGDGGWLSALRALPQVKGASLAGDKLNVALDQLGHAGEVLQWLESSGQKVVHFQAARPDLESVFLSLTGKRLRDA